MNRKHIIIITINIVVCVAFFFIGLLIASRVHAQVPDLPYQIYGKVLNQDGIPLENAEVEAFIDGKLVATSETNTKGKYGIAPKTLIISGSQENFSEKTIEFSVNNVKTQQIARYESGALQELDITVPTSLSVKSDNISQIGSDSVSNSSHYATITAATSTAQREENEIISYTTPIFHIKKQKVVSEYKVAKSHRNPHSKVLGITAGLVIFMGLFWIYVQNYLYARKGSL